MRVRIILTGGTIAMTYDESDGSLRATRRPIDAILSELRLPDLQLSCHDLFCKDSRELTDADRDVIVAEVRRALDEADAILIFHGTDTLQVTGEALHRSIAQPRGPIVLTGAMRPYEFRDSDAAQNVTEALLACRLLNPGVYVAMHNRVLSFPGVVKDRKSLSFVRVAGAAMQG